MSTRLSIALLLCGLVSSVLFGVGAATVLSIPSLSAHASMLLPTVVVASLILAPIICWVIAPTLRAQYIRREVARGLRLERTSRSAK